VADPVDVERQAPFEHAEALGVDEVEVRRDLAAGGDLRLGEL